ncbi:MAG: O-antigen ligase family protein [Actinomycetota bacterium]|nr:O-antigen ligase family protein [Actinomycetota bacterium]
MFVVLTYALPARLVVNGPLGAAGRPSLLTGLAMLVVWAVCFVERDTGERSFQPVRALVGAYLVVWCTSAGLGHLRGLTALERAGMERYLLLTLSLCGVALLTADHLRDRAQIDALLRRLTWLGAWMGFVGLLQFQLDVDLVDHIRPPGLHLNTEIGELVERGASRFTRATGPAQHSIELSVLSAMLVPIAVHYALEAEERATRVRRWLIVVLCGVGVPFSLARSGTVAATAAFLVLLRSWTRRSQRIALVAAAVIVVVLRAAVPGLVGTFVSFFRNAGSDRSVEGRTRDYELVAELFAERPWWGLGAGSFRPEAYFILDNYLLNALVSAGLAGAVLVVALFAVPYSLAVRTARDAPAATDRHLATCLAAALAGGFVSSFTFDSLNFPSMAGTVFLVVGVVGALHRVRDRPGPFRQATGTPPTADRFDGIVKSRAAMRPVLRRLVGDRP